MNSPLSIVCFLATGIALGAGYLSILWVSVKAATRGGGLSPLAVGGVARLALVVAVGYVIVRLGAGGFDMLAALAGFMLARYAGVAIVHLDVPRPKDRADG